ncbi:hypothetical protein WG901_19205 [Novosphingobium sp. PS1R-30]|uniref:MFS transporter n=1 Tax=Novosphingobium anseongense TaxID=3133436 RepID=A0ABU8S0E2_9SPHN
MTNQPAMSPLAAFPAMSLLDRAIFASVSAMSVFALFSPLFQAVAR